jgi:hypothetical protein
VIEADTANGTKVQEQRMTAADYAYDRATLSKMLRRIGDEQGVPPAAFTRIEEFADRLPQGAIADAVASFAIRG